MLMKLTTVWLCFGERKKVQKTAHKMLVKLTEVVNLTNNLEAAFTSESVLRNFYVYTAMVWKRKLR